MATGNQRGERVERVEVPCATANCVNVVRLTRNMAKRKEGKRTYCIECCRTGRVDYSSGISIVCANPTCPRNGEPKKVRPSEAHEGACCSRSCAAQYRQRTKTLMDKKCPSCEKSFSPQWSGQVTCSVECRHKYRQTYDHSDRICLGCGEPFTPKYRGQKYHGHACRQVRITRVCALDFCQKEFSDVPTKMMDKRYCPEHLKIIYRMKNALLDQPWFNGKPKVKVKSASKNGARWYIHIWNPDHPNAYSTGWMAEHVYLICRKLGLDKVDDGFHVDHIDRNGLNNDPSNLRLMTHGEHASHTAQENARRAARYDALVSMLRSKGIDPETGEPLEGVQQ